MHRFEEYATRFVQSTGSKEGAVSPTIVQSASFGYGDPENAEAIFEGSVKKPLYSRMGNPTSAQLEAVLAEMDGGIGAVATSSGMGATALATMSLLRSGDEIISIGGLFSGTYSYFTETLPRFGVQCRFFDVDDLDGVDGAVTEATKLIFLESVGNPSMDLPDIEAVARIASRHGVALVVDNTITPMSVSPLSLGADIVVYSTTKIISGNAAVLGGAAVFRALREEGEKFATPRYADLALFLNKMGSTALIAVAKKRALRDFGMSPSAFNSYLTLLGIETLPLRMERIVTSTERIASALRDAGIAVNHPSLEGHRHHERYKTLFSKGSGTLLTLDFGTKEAAFAFLRRTTLATLTANIGDSRTLALHMASTIYRDIAPEAQRFLGITPGLIRVSVGLENPDDIIGDFIRAASKA